MADVILGFDVGGSGARGVLARPTPGDPVPLAHASHHTPLRTGSHGVDGAAVVIGLAAELLGRYGPARVVAVAVGCAGAQTRGADLRARLPGAVARATGTPVTILCSDMVTSFFGALGGGPGVVLAVGTGAVALGSDLAGAWHRVDGWGDLLGDLGGGAWIGRAGLTAALRAYDGRTGGSVALLAALRDRFGDPGDLVTDLHTRDDRAAVLAAFAPVVLAAARDGDPAARRIRTEAAHHLADTVVAAADRPQGTSARVAVATTGGLLDAHPELVAELRTALPDDLDLKPAAGTACAGALHLARAAVEDRLPPGILRVATITRAGRH